MWWHSVTHGRGSEGETGKWSRYSVLFTLPRNVVYPALLPLMRTPRAASSRLNWRPPADLNGLVRFAERRNLVSARVSSHFKRSLLPNYYSKNCKESLVFGKEVIMAIHYRLIYHSRLLCVCIKTGNRTRCNLLKCVPDYTVSHSKTVNFKVLVSFARCNFARGPC
jgi:hypothetical protein